MPDSSLCWGESVRGRLRDPVQGQHRGPPGGLPGVRQALPGQPGRLLQGEVGGGGGQAQLQGGAEQAGAETEDVLWGELLRQDRRLDCQPSHTGHTGMMFKINKSSIDLNVHKEFILNCLLEEKQNELYSYRSYHRIKKKWNIFLASIFHVVKLFSFIIKLKENPYKPLTSWCQVLGSSHYNCEVRWELVWGDEVQSLFCEVRRKLLWGVSLCEVWGDEVQSL